MNNRFSKLVQTFLTSYIIGECNYSNNTKASYSTTFYLFIQYLNNQYNIKSNNIEIESINKDTILNNSKPQIIENPNKVKEKPQRMIAETRETA